MATEKQYHIDEIVISDGASLFLFKISEEDLESLHADLELERPEHYEEFMFMGKLIKHPRKHKAYGQSYYFSGKHHIAVELKDTPASLINVMNLIEDVCKKDDRLKDLHFNSALVNWYANGNEYIAKHSDDERDIVSKPPIVATLSLGQERVLRLRNKSSGKIVHDEKMTHGSVYIMFGENFQKEYTHEVPKVNGNKGLNMKERISVTLRELKERPELGC